MVNSPIFTMNDIKKEHSNNLNALLDIVITY